MHVLLNTNCGDGDSDMAVLSVANDIAFRTEDESLVLPLLRRFGSRLWLEDKDSVLSNAWLIRALDKYGRQRQYLLPSSFDEIDFESRSLDGDDNELLRMLLLECGMSQRPPSWGSNQAMLVAYSAGHIAALNILLDARGGKVPAFLESHTFLQPRLDSSLLLLQRGKSLNGGEIEHALKCDRPQECAVDLFVG